MLAPKPCRPGRGFYPANLTRDHQIEQYVKEHPEQKAAIYVISSPSCVGKRTSWKPFLSILHFCAFLEPAAKALRDAVKLSDDAAFAKFLSLRANALLSDDYFASDLALARIEESKV